MSLEGKCVIAFRVLTGLRIIVDLDEIAEQSDLGIWSVSVHIAALDKPAIITPGATCPRTSRT